MPSYLRQANADDEQFLQAVYASTRVDEMAIVPWPDEQKSAFVAMQYEAQRRAYLGQFPKAEYSIIVDGDLCAGRLIVDRASDRILIIDIALLPAHRRKGIGSRLIEDLQAEARASERPLWLDVEFFNPAQHLYGRLGFKKIDEMGCYWRLEWRAGEEASNA